MQSGAAGFAPERERLLLSVKIQRNVSPSTEFYKTYLFKMITHEIGYIAPQGKIRLITRFCKLCPPGKENRRPWAGLGGLDFALAEGDYGEVGNFMYSTHRKKGACLPPIQLGRTG